MRSEVDQEYEGLLSRSIHFSESASQMAFLSLATQLSTHNKQVLDVLQQQGEVIQVLQRRTEILSPSKKGSASSSQPPSLLSSPLRTSCSLQPHAPLHPMLHDHVQAPEVAVGDASASPFVSFLSSPQEPYGSLPTHCQPQPLISYENNSSDSLSSRQPIAVNANNTRYYVLPLAPESGHLLLPCLAAFCHKLAATLPKFPVFKPESQNWISILTLIQQRTFCWPLWAPQSLGTYKNIEEIWKEWSEGRLVEGVVNGGKQCGKQKNPATAP
jgi:hypothetical protein